MLYALPDAKVMTGLLPGIDDRSLSAEQARKALADHPGLVPIAVHPGERGKGRRLYFADIEDTPFLEWKHIYTIERLAKEGRITRSFSTDFELLDEPLPVADGMSPDGLLFHVSRCGSTLFCKALARLDSNLIINQGGPLQSGFWAALTDDWRQPLAASEINLDRFRRLVHLMTRRRRPEYQRCIIKFISWNTVCVEFIRAAFPDARALYLYRDPGEVIATVLQETTAALHARGTRLADALTGLPGAQTRGMGDAEFLAHCYGHYFDIVARHADALRLSPVNFRQTRQRENFAGMLEHGFGWRPEPQALETMRAQYDYYSKDDSNKTRYQGEPEDLMEILGEEARGIIDRIAKPRAEALDRLSQNLFPVTG